MFRIVNESAISAGVRRIEAVTGSAAEDLMYAAEDMIQKIGETLNNTQIMAAIKKLVENNESMAAEVEQMRKEQVSALADTLIGTAEEHDGALWVKTQAKRPGDFVKDLAYALRARSSKLAMVIGSVYGDKPMLTIMLGDDVVAAGVNAGAVVREAAKEINGGGGGQAFFATAGGKNVDGIQAAIDKAVALIEEKLK